MSTSIYWIKRQLSETLPIKVVNKNTGEFTFEGNKLVLYCPTTNEYEIDIQVIQKAARMGTNILAYPTQWCRATREAIEHGRMIGIKVIPFGKFIKDYGGV